MNFPFVKLFLFSLLFLFFWGSLDEDQKAYVVTGQTYCNHEVCGIKHVIIHSDSEKVFESKLSNNYTKPSGRFSLQVNYKVKAKLYISMLTEDEQAVCFTAPFLTGDQRNIEIGEIRTKCQN